MFVTVAGAPSRDRGAFVPALAEIAKVEVARSDVIHVPEQPKAAPGLCQLTSRRGAGLQREAEAELDALRKLNGGSAIPGR